VSIHINQWTPDTCKCTLEFSWDDSNPDVITPTRIVRACSIHADMAFNDHTDHFNFVQTENKRKNITLGELLEKAATIMENRGYAFSYTDTVAGGARQLVITVNGISNAQRRTLETLADNKLGIGTVIIA